MAFHIQYLFYDGIGFAPFNEQSNPFTRYAHSYLSALGGKTSQQPLPDNWYTIRTSAQLDILGLPQSATGQTALWTGLNAAKCMGRHITGFPGPTLIPLVHDYSIVKQFCDNGRSATLLNAFSKKYFERVARHPRLKSVSYHVQKAAGIPYMTLDDLKNGRAIFADYTHEMLHRLYPNLKEQFPKRDAYKCGQDLYRISQEYDLVIHEFFMTDKAGHAQSWELAHWCISTIETFLEGLLSNFDTENNLLLISSDHGNMEELDSKKHTANPVPVFAYGKFANLAEQRIRSITDIVPFIYEISGLEVALPVY